MRSNIQEWCLREEGVPVKQQTVLFENVPVEENTQLAALLRYELAQPLPYEATLHVAIVAPWGGSTWGTTSRQHGAKGSDFDTIRVQLPSGEHPG
jgi:hypothetical protein